MATIDHLRVSILDMPREEGMQLIHALRASRREPPAKRKKSKSQKGTRKAKEAKPKEPKMTAAQAVKNMTPEQKALLAKQLLGG